MTTPLPDVARRYRFAPRDRAGVVLGLNAVQCALLGGALILAGVVLQASRSILAASLPVVVAGGLAFGRWRSRPLHEWLPTTLGWVAMRGRGAHRWHTPVPLRTATRRPAGLPEFLTGLEVVDAPGPFPGVARAHGIGVVRDQQGRMLSATLRVRGREFTLLERHDQERILDAWGSALGGFCREHGPVTRISWSEWSAPASLDEHLAFVRHHQVDPAADPGDGGELGRYLDLVANAGPMTTAHDVLVTLTVDRNRATHRHELDDRDPAVEVLAQEVARFAQRLDHAGLTVDPPLSPVELALVLRLRADPTCAARLARRADTIGEAVGAVSAHNWAPAAVAVDWRHVHVDQSWHRSFWIAEWPRLDVPADWMAPLILQSGGIRTLTVVYEPVPPSRSRRAVDRDATRLASDEDQRTRHGFRIRAQHRRAETDVAAREAELVAGYPELTYAGFLTITAPDPERLDAETAEWEQLAAQIGLELRPLDGQHDLGLLTTLPTGRAPAPRRLGP